jgi:REP element-mobilizing transposase RayT
MAFDDVARERFRRILNAQLSFSGVRCITFCLMGNHFHLLLSVPTERASLSAMSDAELVWRCSHIYGKVDDGVAIGSRAFLEEVFRNHRENFGPKRKDGARRMRGADWGELMAMRDVRATE